MLVIIPRALAGASHNPLTSERPMSETSHFAGKPVAAS